MKYSREDIKVRIILIAVAVLVAVMLYLKHGMDERYERRAMDEDLLGGAAIQRCGNIASNTPKQVMDHLRCTGQVRRALVIACAVERRRWLNLEVPRDSDEYSDCLSKARVTTPTPEGSDKIEPEAPRQLKRAP